MFCDIFKFFSTNSSSPIVPPIPDRPTPLSFPKLINKFPKGLRVQHLPEDVDSLFRAVCYYLEDMDPRFLRQLIAARMIEDFNELKMFHDGDDADFFHYIQDINYGKEKGDLLEIEVLQRLLDRPIIIFHADNNPVIPDNFTVYKNEPIFIYRGTTAKHYDVFFLLPEYKASVILDELVAAAHANVQPHQMSL